MLKNLGNKIRRMGAAQKVAFSLPMVLLLGVFVVIGANLYGELSWRRAAGRFEALEIKHMNVSDAPDPRSSIFELPEFGAMIEEVERNVIDWDWIATWDEDHFGYSEYGAYEPSFRNIATRWA